MTIQNYTDFCAALPAAKKASDTILAKLLLRQLSLPVAWFLYRLGVSGNGASLIAISIALVGTGLLVAPSLSAGLVAVVCFMTVALLDCVDGNIARAAGQTGPKGEWIDAVAGYLVYALLPLAVGVRAGMNGAGLDGLPVLLGALAAVLNVFTRLVHQKYETAFLKSPSADKPTASSKSALVGFISGELGLCGIMTPLLLVCVAMNQEIIFVWFYAVIYVIVSTGVVAKKIYSVFK